MNRTITTAEELDDFLSDFDDWLTFLVSGGFGYVMFANDGGEYYATRPVSEDDEEHLTQQGVTVRVDSLPLPIEVHDPSQPAPTVQPTREEVARVIGYHLRTAISRHRAWRDDAVRRGAVVGQEIADCVDIVIDLFSENRLGNRADRIERGEP